MYGLRAAARLVIGIIKPLTRLYAVALLSAAVVFILDRVSKYFALEELSDQTLQIVPGLLGYTLYLNKNIIFALQLRKDVTIAITVAVFLVLCILLVHTWNARRHAQVIALLFILTGAFSNILDRVRLGAVVDYISVPFWSVFNVADMSIVAGVVGLLVAQRGVSEKKPVAKHPAVE